MATKAPVQTTLPLHFIIVGGGLSGLAAAISLQRVGHRVTVLERDAEIPKSGPSGGCRLTPNMTKVLMHWGLKPELQARGVRMRTLVFNSEEPLGRHVYHDDVLLESGGGEWYFIGHTDLRGLLYSAALSHGAEIRTGCNVTAIDPHGRQVSLSDGEVVHGDVIIGADGPTGLCKEAVTGHPTRPHPMGITMYNATMSADAIANAPAIKGGHEETETSVYIWYGNGYCVYSYQMNPQGDHAVHVYGPDDGEDKPGHWGDAPSVNLFELLNKVEPKLAQLVEGASPAVRMRMFDYERLDDWMHEGSERLMLIGEAVHPEPLGALQIAAMCMEDAAVLGKLFSHLKSEDQIANILWGFQDVRQERCRMALQRELQRAELFTLQKGPEQEMRDDSLRQMGTNFESVDEAFYSLHSREEPRVLFAYDCEDQGEEWWQSWGILRERARHTPDNASELKVTMHVEVNAAATA